MSTGITNATITTTDITEPTVTPAPDLPEEPQADWTEERRIAFIKDNLALNARLGEESESRSKKRAMVMFRTGQALDFEYKHRGGSEGAVSEWAKRNKLGWTPCREAMRLYWRCDTPEKRAELENLTITQARRQYQVRYAAFETDRYKAKPKADAPAVDRLQDALLKLTAILDAAEPDDWYKGEPNIGTVTAQIDDVMEKLSGVKKIINAAAPVGQRAEPETAKGSRQAAAAEMPEKKTRRRSKVSDDR
jgi:hypothetical protein